MEQFLEFVNKQQREGKRHLVILEKALKKGNINAKMVDADDPYLFLPSPDESLSFGGVRVYQIGDTIAYRVQKQEKTHPFGRSYLLDVEEMFEDFMTDEIGEETAAQRVVETIADELNKFFQRSKEAEEDIRDIEFDNQIGGGAGMGKIILKGTGGDYASNVYNKT